MIRSIILGLVLLLFVGCSGGQESTDSVSPSPNAAKASDGGASDVLGAPSKAYLNFSNTLAQAKSFKELLPLLASSQAEQARNQQNLDQMLPELKSMIPSNLKVAKESISGSRANLQLKGELDGVPSVGSAVMVKESGKWKLLEENWQSNEGGE